jgi:hypothetical protein
MSHHHYILEKGKKSYPKRPFLIQEASPEDITYRDSWDKTVFGIEWPYRKNEISFAGLNTEHSRILSAAADLYNACVAVASGSPEASQLVKYALDRVSGENLELEKQNIKLQLGRMAGYRGYSSGKVLTKMDRFHAVNAMVIREPLPALKEFISETASEMKVW